MSYIEERISGLIESIAVYTSEKKCDPFELNVMHRTLCDLIAFYEQFWGVTLTPHYSHVISSCAGLTESLACTAVMLRHQKQYDAAASVLKAVIAMDPDAPHYVTLLADVMREKGELAAARAICETVRQANPGFAEIQYVLSQCDMQELLGEFGDYYSLLDMAHRVLRPGAYIEIGVSNGKSLALAREESVAIGMDPLTGEFGSLVFVSPENNPKLFKMTSDDFFSTVDVKSVMEQNTFDMAFIDGLHIFEQVLRDFINLEKHASPASVVFIHDCLPINARVAERVRQEAFWIGDVWKIIPCLKEIRPELQIVTFPAHPSGLAVIRNLDPQSRVLERHFDDIVSHFIQLQLPSEKKDLFALLNVEADNDPELFRRVVHA